MDKVISFPPPKFTTADRAELLRWSITAPAVATWFVQRDPGHGLIATTEDGEEYAALSNGSETAEAAFIVTPERGRWLLVTMPEGNLQGSHRTLREALEAVCRTSPAAA
jgi:hypothetical protein